MKLARGALLIGSIFAAGCALLVSLDDLKGSDASVEAGCGDTQTSSTSCGRCGHDCLGGACNAGVCQPVQLAGGQTDAGWISVDGTYVYWLSGTKALRAPTTLGDARAEPVGGSGAPSPTNLVALSDVHFMSNDGGFTIMRVAENEPPDGAAPTAFASFNALEVLSYARDSAHDYVYVHNSGLCSSNSQHGCILAATDAGVTRLVDAIPPPLGQLDIDQQRIFYYTGSTIASVAFGEDAGTPFASDPLDAGFASIAVDPNNVYVATAAGGIVERVARDGSTFETVALGFSQPHLLVARAGLLAWVTNDGIFACDPNNCAKPTQYVTSPAGTVTSIAVDDAAIYWTDPIHSVIFAIAR